MVFKVLQKDFHYTRYTSINFLFATLKLLIYFENAYWNPPQVERSLAPTSHWLQGKCARIYLSQAASGMILPAALCKHFQSKNQRFRVFEADYWKDFQISN
jgi:hypothetical protein